MNHYVYEITNLINGMKYIGKRSCNCDIEDDKYMGSSVILKRSINKYGTENFKKEVLTTCDSEDQAYTWEDFYTMQVSAWSNPMYYNLKRGGLGGKRDISDELRNRYRINNSGENHPQYGKKHSEETKKKIGEFKKGNKNMLGKKHSEETKKRLSELNKGKPNPNKGIKMSDETRMKMSEAKKGKPSPMKGIERSEEFKTKLRIANIGKKLSKETREKMGKSREKKVILLNTKEVFNSLNEAIIKVNLKNTVSISMNCKNKKKSAGKINGEPAKWMYYEEYLNIKNNNMEVL